MRKVIDCTPYADTPFKFWTTRPELDGRGVKCVPCATQSVDWQRASPDEMHLAEGVGVQVGDYGAFSSRDYIRGLAINYLLTDAESMDANCVRQITRRGWWADAWRTDGFRMGSRLWTLQWERTVSETLVKARQYAAEALQPLLEYHVASSIDVKARLAGRDTIVIDVTINGPWGPIGFSLSGIERIPYGFLWREVRDG